MKKKLLIIEDEKSVAKQLRWGLSEEYEITIASSATQAAKLLEISRPTLHDLLKKLEISIKK